MKRLLRLLVALGTVQLLALATLAVVHSPAQAWERNYEGPQEPPQEGGDPDEPSGGLLASELANHMLDRWEQIRLWIIRRAVIRGEPVAPVRAPLVSATRAKR